MVKIGVFLIDASIRESHTFASELTAHPVEEGADVTDHVRTLPITLTIDGIVSDTPIGAAAVQRANESPLGGEFLPSRDALAYLRGVRLQREPVTVETSLSTYENMVLTSLQVPQDARTGDSLRFTASFQQIEIVRTERAPVAVATPRAQSKRNRGAKPSKAVEESKALERQRQFKNEWARQHGLAHDPLLGTDLL